MAGGNDIDIVEGVIEGEVVETDYIEEIVVEESGDGSEDKSLVTFQTGGELVTKDFFSAVRSKILELTQESNKVVVKALVKGLDPNSSKIIELLNGEFGPEFDELITKLKSLAATAQMMKETNPAIAENIMQQIDEEFKKFTAERQSRIAEITGLGREQLVPALAFFARNVNVLDQLTPEELAVVRDLFSELRAMEITERTTALQINHLFMEIREELDLDKYDLEIVYSGSTNHSIVISRKDKEHMKEANSKEYEQVFSMVKGLMEKMKLSNEPLSTRGERGMSSAGVDLRIRFDFSPQYRKELDLF